MLNTLINAGKLLSVTTDVIVASAASNEDVVLDAIVAYNSHSSALVVTLTLWEVFVATSVAAGATVNLIDGYQLPIKAGQSLLASTTTANKVVVKPLGKKASEGNISTRAVIWS